MTNRPSVHKSLPRFLLRWSITLAACVLLSIGFLRLKARDEFLAMQFAACASDERLYAERWPVASSTEREWIRKAAAYTATVKAEYKWASRYPWRRLPNRPAGMRAGD